MNEDKPEEQVEVQSKNSTNSSKPIVIGIVLFLFIIISSLTYIFYFQNKPDIEESKDVVEDTQNTQTTDSSELEELVLPEEDEISDINSLESITFKIETVSVNPNLTPDTLRFTSESVQEFSRTKIDDTSMKLEAIGSSVVLYVFTSQKESGGIYPYFPSVSELTNSNENKRITKIQSSDPKSLYYASRVGSLPEDQLFFYYTNNYDRQVKCENDDPNEICSTQEIRFDDFRNFSIYCIVNESSESSICDEIVTNLVVESPRYLDLKYSVEQKMTEYPEAVKEGFTQYLLNNGGIKTYRDWVAFGIYSVDASPPEKIDLIRSETYLGIAKETEDGKWDITFEFEDNYMDVMQQTPDELISQGVKDGIVPSKLD